MTAIVRRIPRARPVIRTTDIMSLRLNVLKKYWLSQNLAFWGMCGYLIVEYIRPQQLIEAIKGFPLGQIVLGTTVIAWLGTGAKGAGLKGAGGVLMLVFTAVIMASSVGAYRPDYAWAAMRDWLSWVAIFILIVNVINTEERFLFFLGIWMMCHYYMSQGGFKQFAFRGFTFTSWGIKGAPGWFENSGEFGIAMCMFLPITWHFYLAAKPYMTKWRRVLVLGAPITAIFGILGCSSRGAVLGLLSVGFVELMQSKQRARGLILIAVVGTAGWFILPAEQKLRFTQAGTDQTSLNRMTYWKNGLDMVHRYPILGIGYNNWLSYYQNHYGKMTGYEAYGIQLPHNVFIQCMAELGYTGLFVFGLLILCTTMTNFQTRKIARAGPAPPNTFIVHMTFGLDAALVGFLSAGFFVTVLYYPFFWINLALTVALNAIAKSQQRAVGKAPAAASLPRRGVVPRPRPMVARR